MANWLKIPTDGSQAESDSLQLAKNELVLDNRGLAYADGFFSTMGVFQGAILWLEYHRQRFISHATALQLVLDIELLMQQLIKCAETIQEGILKVVITRQPQSVRGYGFSNGEVDVFVRKLPMSMTGYQTLLDGQIPIQNAGKAVCLSAQIACLPQPLVGLKSLNRLDSVMVAGEFEAVKQHHEQTSKLDSIHADYTKMPHTAIPMVEGLVADVTGQWVEGVMSNVFYQLKHNGNSHQPTEKAWYTPPISRSGVAGVMRQVILDKWQDKWQGKWQAHQSLSAKPANQRLVEERELSTEDLENLSSLFFCNAVRGVVPICQLYLPKDLQSQQKKIDLSISTVVASFQD